jgi:uncharacterized membrane protein YfcA
MTKLFLKHLAKQIGFVAGLFGVMFASSWIANQLFNEPLFGLVGLLVAFMVFWMVSTAWSSAKREVR